MIEVFLAKAMICIAGQCYPALVGRTTPIGTYTLQRIEVEQKGYGGDILAFHMDPNGDVFAIHRLYLLNRQQRDKRILSNRESDRVITNGCINIQTEVYDQLTTGDILVVRP